jgi:protein MpaA
MYWKPLWKKRKKALVFAGPMIIWLGLVMFQAGSAYSLGECCPAAGVLVQRPLPGSLNTWSKGAVVMVPPDATANSALIKKQIFHSVRGQAIEAYEFGTGEHCTLIIGGVHGDEPEGVVLAQALLKYLQSLSMPDFRGKVVLIPVANPDGYKAHTRRNARKIDINRNFPTNNYRERRLGQRYNPGKKPASEPETQAILKVAGEYRPDLIITFHADLKCVNYDGPGAEVAARMGAANEMPVKADLGYETPGSLGTYFGRERHIPVITLELRPKDDQWARHRVAILSEIGVKVVARDEPSHMPQ